MSRSLKTFRNEFTQGLLNFIWRQWQQMGVAGSVSGNVGWFIDLEPVLAFTTEIARHDARIFDEVLDWLTVNGQWVNTQRLATILDTDDVGSRPVIGAIASWLTEIDKSAKWRGLARKVGERSGWLPVILATEGATPCADRSPQMTLTQAPGLGCSDGNSQKQIGAQ